MNQYITTLSVALSSKNGAQLAQHLRPNGPHTTQLLAGLFESSRTALARYSGTINSPWDEIAVAHVQVVVNCKQGTYLEACREQAILTQAFLRYFITKPGWTLPALYAILRDLRDLAFRADEACFMSGQPTQSLEDAARICNKAFSNCVTDRTSKKEESRKWGIYYVVGMVIKCYFKVNRISLSRNIIRALKANPDIPPLSAYPRADQVTYRYYLGLLSFLNEDFNQAEEELTFAFYNCYRSAVRNQERILTYLLPLRMLKGQLPSQRLMSRFPALEQLFSPFMSAIRGGDLEAYDKALNFYERRLVEIGLWLIVERAREIALRGLFRRVWVANGKSTRIPITMFHAALRISGQEVDMEETECLVATMIYKGYVRGYISHAKQMVVLANTSSFPRLIDRPTPFVGVKNDEAVPRERFAQHSGRAHPGPCAKLCSLALKSMGNNQSSKAETIRRHSSGSLSPRISRPSPLSGATTRQMTTSSSTSTPPPPPYSSIAQNTLVEDPDATPPPVPPRSPPRQTPQRNRASIHVPPSTLSPPVGAHRRTVSHSTPSRTSQQSRSADGSRGFRGQSDNVGPSPTRVSVRAQPTQQLSSVPMPTRVNSQSREDPLILLRKYDTVIIVDDSASMAGPLWFEARNALAGVAEIAGKYDEDGIDVHFLNDRTVGLNLRTARDVERLFDTVAPDGITPTGEKLEELLLEYLLVLESARDQADSGDPGPLKSVKPVNFIVLTDGAPTDDPESVIVTAARRLDARNFPISQVGIQFVQIGSDPRATEALQELDDDLASQHGIRDMVDTTPYSGGQVDSQMLTKILLGGVNRRVDKRGAV